MDEPSCSRIAKEVCGSGSFKMLVGFGGSEKGGFKGNWVKGSEFAFFIRDGGEM